MTSIKDWWSTQEAARKKWLVIGGLAVGVLVLAVFGGGEREKRDRDQVNEKPETTILADDRGEADIAELNAKNKVMADKVAEMERDAQDNSKRIQRLQASISAYTGLQDNPEQLAALVDELQRMRADLDRMQGDGGATQSAGSKAPVTLLTGKEEQTDQSAGGEAAVVADPFSDAGDAGGEPVSQYIDPLSKIKGVLESDQDGKDGGQNRTRFGAIGEAELAADAPQIIIEGSSEKGRGRAGQRNAGNRVSQSSRDQRTEELYDAADDTVYLPSGSLFRGVLLNGMDAPTGQNASSDPYPVTIRLTSLAFLPNRFTTNIKDCFVLAAGVGRMDSERVMLRTERLSCVTQEDDVLDVTLDGYVTGEDGKVGLRGQVVERTGALLARAALAGLASGLAEATRPQVRTTIQTGDTAGGIQYESPETSKVAEVGAYAGVSNAMDMVAKYYLDRAEQIFPVIELDPLRPVVVHLSKGVKLELREGAHSDHVAQVSK